jgi:hypothetical protein
MKKALHRGGELVLMVSLELTSAHDAPRRAGLRRH